jgi:hypothetical protein
MQAVRKGDLIILEERTHHAHERLPPVCFGLVAFSRELAKESRIAVDLVSGLKQLMQDRYADDWRAALLPVWDLGGPGRFARHGRRRWEAVAACRREVAGQATWLVPPDFNPADAAAVRWLSLGGWTFYRAPGPVLGKWPDVFRCGAPELLAWMSARSVQVVLESFYDDTDWVVAVSGARRAKIQSQETC